MYFFVFFCISVVKPSHLLDLTNPNCELRDRLQCVILLCSVYCAVVLNNIYYSGVLNKVNIATQFLRSHVVMPFIGDPDSVNSEFTEEHDRD